MKHKPKLIELQYQSRFDHYIVRLGIGDVARLNQLFRGLRAKNRPNMFFTHEGAGAYIYFPEWKGDAECLAQFSEYLVKVSFDRFEHNGVLKRHSFNNELIAYSVEELATGLLEKMVEASR